MIPREVLELSRYRLSKAQTILHSAHILFDNEDYAGSVNRSYYSVFTAARALLALKGLDSKKHSGVIALFNQHYVMTGIINKEAGKILRTAKGLREDSDYADFVEISREVAASELKKAEELLKEIEAKIAELSAKESG